MKGVKLLLVPGVSVRWWIRDNSAVRIKREVINGKTIKCVLIENGFARFADDGAVSIVTLPGFRGPLNRIGFEKGEVLEIRDLDGNVIERLRPVRFKSKVTSRNGRAKKEWRTV